MKFKDLITKYEKLEIISPNEIILTKYDKVYKKYKDYEVLSIKDYDDTKTTSVILKEE